MKKNIFLVFFILSIGINLYAQQLYMPRNVQRAFKNETRSPDGNPGKNYWQNTAQYNISINVAPPGKTVSGTEEITYTNNSPDSLNNLVFRLIINSHNPEAPREQPVATNYLTSGVQIDEYRENDKVKAWRPGKGTAQGVKLDKPLAPHESIKLSFKWHYDVSAVSNREGALDDTSFFIAYFYPRVSVYDDIDGWDTASFTEGHEFYNDFNNYTLEVTAPKNFIVWATGDLQNPNEVLQPEFAERLKKSMTSDDVIHIATLAELQNNSVTLQKDMLTWKWKADNISDVALAVSNHYIWDGGSIVVDKSTNRRASVQSAYNVEAKDFEHMVEFGKHTLDWASNNFPGVPYPFSKTTIFRGEADMEYPMMVNDSSNPTRPDFSKFVVEHEILHTWFPFYMGINERRYGFMDEGWTTAFENMIGRADVGKEAADQLFKGFRVASWIKSATADGDIPIITPGDAMVGRGFGNNEYGKAGLGYIAIRDLMGDEEFKKCLHEFMSRWHGKHPQPWDMFNSFNSAAGKDYNWFFNNWYFTNGYIDLAVGSVTPSANGYSLKIENIGGFAAPVDVIVSYEDGTKETLHQTPIIWNDNSKEATVNISTSKKINSIVLDGGIFMDADETNNKWEKK